VRQPTRARDRRSVSRRVRSLASLLAAIAAAGAVSLGCREHSAPEPKAASDSVATVSLRYEIGGMHCSGCSAAIKAKTLEIVGVREAMVDHENGLAEFTVTSESLDAMIRAAVERLGYTITRAS